MGINDDLLDEINMPMFNDGRHSSAKTFMIIMAVLWGLLLFVDLAFLMVFNFLFAVAGAFLDDMPFQVDMLYWNFILYPFMMLIALVGGFTSLNKHQYGNVYVFGLLPLINIVLFFILIAIIPSSAGSPAAF